MVGQRSGRQLPSEIMAINELLPQGLLPPLIGYQPVRVSSHSKMRHLVQFALTHLNVCQQSRYPVLDSLY